MSTNNQPTNTPTPEITSESEKSIRGLASLKFRDYRLLFFSTPFSSAGMAMETLANAWQVYQLTGSTAQLGLTFLFQGIPSIGMSLFGGTLADKFDRKRLINIGQAFNLLMAVLLAVITLTGVVRVWHIFTITFMISVIGNLTGPARSALMPDLVPRAYLLNATTLMTTGTRMATMTAPLLGGVILGQMGAGSVYVFNAFLILPAVIATAMIKIPPNPNARKVRFNLQAIFGGLRFAIQSQVLLLLLLMDTITQVLGYYPAMMPVIADEVLKVGPTGLGLLLTAPAIGEFAGFAGILMVGNIKRKGLVLVGTIVLYCALLVVFAQAESFIFALMVLGLLGAVDAVSMSIRQTSLQLLAPAEIRGRVLALTSVFAVGGNSLGGAYLGLIAQFVGIQTAIAMGGIIAGGFALTVGIFSSRVRKFTA